MPSSRIVHRSGISPRPGEFAVDRGLALADAASRERGGKQDHSVGLDKIGGRREPAGEFLGDEICRQRPRTKTRFGRDRRQKGDVVLHAADIEAVEGGAQTVDRGVAVGAIGESLAIIGS